MSDKQKHKNPRIRQNQKFQAAPQTAEERAAALAAHQKAEAEAKVERERIELFGKSVGKMSHRQLRGELKRLIRREYSGKPPVANAGLTIGLGAVLLAVLDNTKTVPDKHTRPDQINPFGKLSSYPR